MSDFSTNLQLPYLMPAQAQKHVTVNEALRRLDVLVQMRAQSRAVTAQPAAPGDGELWILPPGKTGADWDGFAAGRVAYYRDGAWEEIAPRAGWFAFVADETALVVHDGSGWISVVEAAGGLLEADLAAAAAVKALDQQVKAGSVPAFAGIAFPASASPSADPNTLDDYEEGEWTPSVTSSGGAIGAYTVNGASYEKIGRAVLFRVDVSVTDNGAGAGLVEIGLPFAAGGGARVAVAGRENGLSGHALTGVIPAGASVMNVVRYDATYPAVSGARLVLSGVYRV